MLPTDFVRPNSQVQQLGAAPLGVLAEALEPDDGEHLLLKAVRVTDLESRSVLMEEAQRLTRIPDEAAAILQVKKHGGYVFMSSQWVEGEALERWDQLPELGAQRVREWARQLFEQLAQAHAADVLHRAIGPASIRVENGTPRLVGFSVNAVAANGSYRAPEVSSDDLADAMHSTRSDVYSLGRVLEELMARQSSTDRNSPWAMLLQACTHPNPDLRPSDAAAVLSAWAGMEQEPPPGSLETADYGADATEFAAIEQGAERERSPAEEAEVARHDPVARASLGRASNEPEVDAPDLMTTVGFGDAGARGSLAQAGSAGFVEPVEPVEPVATITDGVSERPRTRTSRLGLVALAAAIIVGAVFLVVTRTEWFVGHDKAEAPPRPASAEQADDSDQLGALSAPPEAATSGGDGRPARDAALSLAQNLVLGNQSTLFSGNDEELAGSLRDDLASLDFGADSRGSEIASSLFGANPLTQDRNPLLNPEVREAWIAEAIRNVGDRDLIAHLTEESEKLRGGTVTLAEWYEHVAACREVCNLVVLGLLQEHIRRVQTLPHQLLLFNVNDDQIRADLSTDLDRFVSSKISGQTRFLLIGRASRTGQREYNRDLSRRRVEAAQQKLVELGVPSSKIEALWLGYEPPQISDALAARYSVDASLSAEQRNQSVLLVAH